MRFASVLALSLATTMALPAGVVRADPPAPAVGSDVVRTVDGRVLRGTIIEKDPKGEVTIQLVTGALRTIPMKDVLYAGPLVEPLPPPAPPPPAPPPPPPPAPAGPRPVAMVHAEEAKVHVDATTPHVALHLRAGTSDFVGTAWTTSTRGGSGWGAVSGTATNYQDLCTAPCDLSMAKGEYRVGLSLEGGGVKAVDEPLVVRGPMTIHAEYESRLGYRVAGWTVLVAGSIAGTSMMLAGLNQNTSAISSGNYNDKPGSGLVGAGLGVALGSLALGLVLAFVQDRAEITTEAAPPPPRAKDTTPKPAVHASIDGVYGTF
jgi:hypothetical protein